MKELEIKPNYTELGRKYKCDPRTVKKYNNGYEGKSKTRKRNSKLDKYKEEIKEKVNYVGSTIKAVYEYMKVKIILIQDMKHHSVNNYNLTGKNQ